LRRRLGAAGVSEVAVRYQAGESIKQIASSINASNDAVIRLLGEEGVPTWQPRYLTAQEME
jgi:hypothetical protein